MKIEELEESGKPYKIYAKNIEQGALDQFIEAMKLPCSVKGSLMPDAHLGYSIPIGGVVATKDIIFPSWCGVDIGCGMAAIKLKNIKKEEIDVCKEEIFKAVYKNVPTGFKINSFEKTYTLEGLTDKGKEIAETKDHKRALGSLGGGNHFIEIGYDEEGNVWIIVHSGSRGVGHGIAVHYISLAHPEGKCKDGNYGFDVNSQEGKDYLQDMEWCLQYALDNRKDIIREVVYIINVCVGMPRLILDRDDFINRNHNHIVEKDGLWIHRKGATHAEKGMMGVIPGNMRDGSFIVRGKGPPDSLWSSSHGAGRVLGRKRAQRELDLNKFKDTMCGVQAKVCQDTLDESPFAYKNIFEVMELQRDLVEVVAHVKPIVNIKG